MPTEKLLDRKLLGGGIALLVLSAIAFFKLQSAPKGLPAAELKHYQEQPPGQTIDYQLAFRANAELGALGTLSTSVEGRYATRVVGEVDGKTLVEAKLDPSDVSVGGADPRAAESLKAALGTRFFFTRVEELVSEVRIPAQVDPTAARILRSIVAASQFTRKPAEVASPSWKAIEADTNGRYEAAYGEISAQAFMRRKDHYIELQDPTTGAVEAQITEGVTQFELDEGSLSSLDAIDDIILRTPNGLLGNESRARTQLKLKRLRKGLSISGLKEAVAAAGRIDGEPLHASRSVNLRRAADESAVANRTFPQMLAELRALSDDDDAQRKQRSLLFRSVASLMRLDDRVVDEVLARILKNDPDMRFLRDALASAGTPKAQRALITAIQAEQRVIERSYALVGLSSVAQPTPETLAELRRLKSDPVHGIQARYGLGTAADRLRESMPEQAKEIVDELVGDLRNAATPTDTKHALLALGNAAVPDAVELTKPYLKDSKPAIREAAVQCLKDVPGVDSDAVLLNALLGDGSAGVRRTVAIVFRDRRPSDVAISGLMDSARNEQDSQVRLSVATTLLHWAKTDRRVTDAVVYLAQNDPLPEIRNAATAFLAH